MKQIILNNFAFNLFYMKKLTEDIASDKMCEQPFGLANHPAWVIGHLALANSNIGQMIGGEPSISPEWKELFDMGSKPVSDPSKYPDKTVLLAAFEKGHQQFSNAYEHATQAALDAPLPMEELRELFPTIGQFVVFAMTSHEGIHIGQLTAWRRAQGLPLVF